MSDKIKIQCECGVVVSAPGSAAGKTGRCRACGKSIKIPSAAAAVAVGASAGSTSDDFHAADAANQFVGMVCSICHSVIEADEETTSCDECGLPFHIECWEENLGCSAYGCGKVNALKQGPDISVSPETAATASPESALAGPAVAGDAIPWDYLLLAMTTLATLIGLFAFGLLAAITAFVTLAWFVGSGQRRPSLACIGSLVLSVIGFFMGLYASRLYWW